MIETRIKNIIRDIPDFPKPGIVFKDITPILLDSELCSDIVDAFIERLNGSSFDYVCGIESRGFFFGLMIANKLGIPFVPIRKKGKLPGNTISYSYDLEYGSATIEIHDGVVAKGSKVMIHDDLLATGGTAIAATELIKSQGASVEAYSFLVDLSFLNGAEKLNQDSKLIALVQY